MDSPLEEGGFELVRALRVKRLFWFVPGSLLRAAAGSAIPTSVFTSSSKFNPGNGRTSLCVRSGCVNS